MYLPILEKTNHNQEYILRPNDFGRVCKFCILPIFLGNFLGFSYMQDSLKAGLVIALLSQIPILICIIVNQLLIYRKLKKHLTNRHYRLKLFTFQDIIIDSFSNTTVSLAFSYEDEIDQASRKVIAEYQRETLSSDIRKCKIFPLTKGGTFKTPYGLLIRILEIENNLANNEITGVTLEVIGFRRSRIIWKIF